MEKIDLKVGQFIVVATKFSIPVIRVAYAGVLSSGMVSLVCMLNFGQASTSFNLYTRLNQPVSLGIDLIKSLTVTRISNNGSEISIVFQ